ncbi:uncharacterized protein C1orf21 homolog isoform X1 [Alexandromys fortis]|uniref:uncharacterized protein C1orf21 homolog isoform X1 n=1 Tax=Alexandromys fortis TaxID=100897 RepID=UPI00215233E0|nr:uncharacterized protein C1orf21 homolog isoform X1 [Microtus fortis]
MGCASAKHVATVQNEEEAQKGKNYQNGDVFGDEYRIKPVEEVKYMKNGAEEEQKIAARNQENLIRLFVPLVHRLHGVIFSLSSQTCMVKRRSGDWCFGMSKKSLKKVPARMRGLKLIKKSLDWSINPEQTCTSLKANKNSSECWMKKLKRVGITVLKKRILHSIGSPTRTRSYYCVNRLHPS